MMNFGEKLAVASCLFLLASCVSAETEEAPPSVVIRVTDFGPHYVAKESDTIPSIQRGEPFEVRLIWSRSTNIQRITFRDFRALLDDGRMWRTDQEWPGKVIDFENPEADPEQAMAAEGDRETTTEGILEVDRSIRERLGDRRRLITLTVELETRDGTRVTFDPPWDEKP